MIKGFIATDVLISTTLTNQQVPGLTDIVHINKVEIINKSATETIYCGRAQLDAAGTPLPGQVAVYPVFPLDSTLIGVMMLQELLLTIGHTDGVVVATHG